MPVYIYIFVTKKNIIKSFFQMISDYSNMKVTEDDFSSIIN